MKKIRINDLTIRDIFQNINTGYISEKLLIRIIEHLGKIKFDSLEVFGGSAFEKMLDNRFYKSPFEIASIIKEKTPQIKLQALIGARNLIGMEIYSKPVIKKFISECKKSGIERFRVFDSLNDIENFKFTLSAIVENEMYCQGTIIYDDLKDIDFYINLSEELSGNGCKSICIKDEESTLVPSRSIRLFKNLTENIDVPFYLSTYNLRGLQISNYYSAFTAGCKGVDMSFIPSSYNDLTPPIFPFILSLKDTDVSMDLDYVKLLEIFEWFQQNIYPTIRNELLHSKFLFSNKNQNLLPKWLLSSINNQLKEIGESNKIDLVLEEVIKIKNEIGNPSLSTPVGQIIGTQAILNTIISDYRWEIINNEIKKLTSGYYGRLPRKVDPELLGMINKEHKKTVENNGAYNINNHDEDKTLDQCAAEIQNLSKKDSDILCYLFFPDKTVKLLEDKKDKKPESPIERKITGDDYIINAPGDFESGQKTARFNDIDLKKIREITNLVETSGIDEIKLEIEGVKISINKKEKSQTEKIPASPGEDIKKINSQIEDSHDKDITLVRSPIVGTFYSSPGPDEEPFVEKGSIVKKDDTLCIIEAMKLMNKITAECDGEIIDIMVKNEQVVEYDQVIMKIRNV